MTEFQKIRPDYMEILARTHPGVVETLENASKQVRTDLNLHLDAIREGAYVGPLHVYELAADMRREGIRGVYCGTCLPGNDRPAWLDRVAGEIEASLQAAGEQPPAQLFRIKVGKATSRIEKLYAHQCAKSVATEARKAIVREDKLRMRSEMIALQTGIEKAIKAYSKPHAAATWIGVLHELASSEMDDGFIVLARELAGMEAPASADQKLLASMETAKEAFRRIGLLRSTAPSWTTLSSLTKGSQDFLAFAGRSLDASLVEHGLSEFDRYEIAAAPNEIVQAELLVYGLLVGSVAMGAKQVCLTPLGQKAALHYAAKSL